MPHQKGLLDQFSGWMVPLYVFLQNGRRQRQSSTLSTCPPGRKQAMLYPPRRSKAGWASLHVSTVPRGLEQASPWAIDRKQDSWCNQRLQRVQVEWKRLARRGAGHVV